MWSRWGEMSGRATRKGTIGSREKKNAPACLAAPERSKKRVARESYRSAGPRAILFAKNPPNIAHVGTRVFPSVLRHRDGSYPTNAKAMSQGWRRSGSGLPNRDGRCASQHPAGFSGRATSFTAGWVQAPEPEPNAIRIGETYRGWFEYTAGSVHGYRTTNPLQRGWSVPASPFDGWH